MTTSSIFEPEFVAQLAKMFGQRISFNRLINLRIVMLEAAAVSGQIETRPELRVDYLRPALGPRFTAHASVLRLSSRVASTRMEFQDAQGVLVSTAAAAYIIA